MNTKSQIHSLSEIGDSEKPFIHYRETPNMLLIDYFTYIGGLFGLCFGICLHILLELFINYIRFLRKELKRFLNYSLVMIRLFFEFLFNLIKLFLNKIIYYTKIICNNLKLKFINI